MWVSKTVSAQKDLSIQFANYMVGVFTFIKDNLPYSLVGITTSFRIYSPGNDVPVLIMTDGNGYVQAANTLTFNKQINLATGMYKYELILNFPAEFVSGVFLDGAFWVRKSGAASSINSELIVQDNFITVLISITPVSTSIIETSEDFTGSVSANINLAHTPMANSLKLFKNGSRLPASEFALNVAAITLNTARELTDVFTADYKYY